MAYRLRGRLPPLIREALAEFMATFILVVCTSSIHFAILFTYKPTVSMLITVVRGLLSVLMLVVIDSSTEIPVETVNPYHPLPRNPRKKVRHNFAALLWVWSEVALSPIYFRPPLCDFSKSAHDIGTFS